MSSHGASLDLGLDAASLTEQLCNIESVSLHEAAIADAVAGALDQLPHLAVSRLGNTVVARTESGRNDRVVIAGHLDTVPLTNPPNLPVQRRAGQLWGRGTVDMKGGVAVALRLAHAVATPRRDVTYVFYEGEEIASEYNGLGLIARSAPALIDDASFAVLMEPTAGHIEGGCNGTLRAEVAATGVAAHSARPWQGSNAIHALHRALATLADYSPRTAVIDGLEYREAVQAVRIEGGIAGNVVPDRAVLTVNYRYAPDQSAEQAVTHVEELFGEYAITVVDNAPGALPGLDQPAARDFVTALNLPVVAKQGWTDVARFSAMGIPAVNFGPGDPSLAHHDDEQCPIDQLEAVDAAMLTWLS